MRLLILLSITCLLGGCFPGTTARPAQTLAPGELEISGGVVSAGLGVEPLIISQLLLAAVGVCEHVDVEARWESGGGSGIARYQFLEQEKAKLDATTWAEIGGGDDAGFFVGTGAVLSRRLGAWEPYLSYRYRYATSGRLDSVRILDLDSTDPGIYHIHYIHVGMRAYLDKQSKLFCGAELGANSLGSDVVSELALVVGLRI